MSASIPPPANFTLANAALPPSSLVLVTGANGLIASHVADQLLSGGFRVRGSVRSLSKNTWLSTLLESRHGPGGRFELVEVPDIARAGAWTAALRGVAAVVQVAGPASFDIADADETAAEESAALQVLLEAAAAATEPKVQSFVLTGSAWAAWRPDVKVARTLTADTWNDEAVELAARAEEMREEERGLVRFMAVKVKVERAAWRWVSATRPSFRFNVVLADTVLGPVLDAAQQPGSTAGLVRALWHGHGHGHGQEGGGGGLEVMGAIAPQWFVDARDLGRVYAAALGTAADGERLFAFAGRYSWHRVLAIMKVAYPDRAAAAWVNLADDGWDQTVVPNETALELLRATGQDQWISLQKSVEDGVESLALEGK